MSGQAARDPIYTVGHSTRTLDEFQKILGDFRIELVLDVRTVPRSRHVPHFNGEALTHALKGQGIDYFHLKRLGGLRKPVTDSPNRGWRNLSFRGFADYMQTGEFEMGLAELLEFAGGRRAVLMCAEALPWRCHRSLIADALLVRGLEVLHIISKGRFQPHGLTPFAVAESGRITYPQVRAGDPSA